MRRAATGLLLVSLLVPACSREAPTPASVPPRRAPRSAAVAPAPGRSKANAERRKVVVYDPGGRRDPFISLVPPEAEERGFDVSGYKLSGIVWQRNQYYALLEAPDGLGHVLKVDDWLGPNARVKGITKDTVLIEMKDRDHRGRGHVRTIRLELVKEEGE